MTKEFKYKYLPFILGAALLALVGCTDSDDDDDDNGNGGPTASASATATPGVVERVEDFNDGPGGNLWKPVSENNGNVVVLFNNSFRRVFSGGCSLELNDGTFEQMYCGSGGLNCFTNPDRLTMRSNVKCSRVKEVKVVCQSETEIVTFTVDPTLRNQICERHD